MNNFDLQTLLPTSFGSRRRHFKQNKRLQHNKYKVPLTQQIVDYEVEETFNKCYLFNAKKINTDFKLPNPASFFREDKWKLKNFQELKYALNNTKSKLNDLNLKEWHRHTTNTNIAGDVIKKLKYDVGPEFLTQAWCKMYECLTKFRLVPDQLPHGNFNSLHLCEAPGAFITALHHYLQTWYPETEWNWLATTLNPYHESNPPSQMIQDDRFIMHTLRNWTFGQDGTGNLMDVNNLKHLQDQVDRQLGGNVMLVTADGSIDCQTNPAEQERLVAPLQYCETFTALSILQPGGHFVLKMFTLLECESMCLMYLLVCTFTSVFVFKPVKSKEGNSEVYVICSGYKGKQSLFPWMPILHQHFGPSISKAMFCEKDIPEDFKIQMYECAKRFTYLQIRVIERNLDLFHFPKPAKQLQSRLAKRQVAERYLLHYQVFPVNKVIVGNDILAETPTYNLAQRCEEGTFNERIGQACPNPSVLLASARSAICPWPFTEDICWFQFNSFKQPALEVKFGRPITTINSSKFCHSTVLDAFNQVQSTRLLTSEQREVPTSMVLDVRHLPWTSQHSQSNYTLLNLVLNYLQNLKANQSFFIHGIPLLSQFIVAAILLLAHSFDQVGLSKAGNVIFCGYQRTVTSIAWLQDTLGQISRLLPSMVVFSLLPINVLCDKGYCMSNGISFYLCVTSINNARLLQSLENELQQAETLDKATDQY